MAELKPIPPKPPADPKVASAVSAVFALLGAFGVFGLLGWDGDTIAMAAGAVGTIVTLIRAWLLERAHRKAKASPAVLSGFVLLVLLGSSLSCAGSSLEKSVDAVEVGLVGLDVVVEESAPEWRRYVEAQVARCKAEGHTTKAEGRACLGPAAEAERVEDLLRVLVDGQESLAEALDALRELIPILQRAKEAAPP